jgi:sec-independent protein translocase protein TatC
MSDPKPKRPENAVKAPEDDVEMGFFDHLAELRSRILKALAGIVPCGILAWTFVDTILGYLLRPLMTAYEALGIPTQVHFANPVDPFVAKLKVAAISGLLLAAPWVFWQLWGFIAPGLYRKERFLAIPFVFFSTLCFSGGACFGYFIVFPPAFQTLLEFGGGLPTGMVLTPTLMVSDVLDFVTRMLLAFGAVFELPVIITFLAAADIVTWRQLLSFGRWWIVVAAVIAAVLTPPDVGSQTMMLIPLVVLYFVSVGIAFLIQFRRKKAAEATGA